jgi:hypothetical protein
VSARERESEDRERFSLRICSRACGGSSSSSSSGVGGASGGVPSAGTKKVPPVSARGWREGGVILRARDFARGEDRRRWAKRRVAMCVEVTVAGSSAEDEAGGDARACRRGVMGGASEGPADS